VRSTQLWKSDEPAFWGETGLPMRETDFREKNICRNNAGNMLMPGVLSAGACRIHSFTGFYNTSGITDNLSGTFSEIVDEPAQKQVMQEKNNLKVLSSAGQERRHFLTRDPLT